MLRKQFNAIALAPSDLIAEKLIERRDNTVISCSRGDLLVKIDKQFHHSAISNDVLVVTSSDQQGKYVCLEDNNYPSMIYYVQLSGNCQLIIFMYHVIQYYVMRSTIMSCDTVISYDPSLRLSSIEYYCCSCECLASSAIS